MARLSYKTGTIQSGMTGFLDISMEAVRDRPEQPILTYLASKSIHLFRLGNVIAHPGGHRITWTWKTGER